MSEVEGAEPKERRRELELYIQRVTSVVEKEEVMRKKKRFLEWITNR